jgi:hypothetical protein
VTTQRSVEEITGDLEVQREALAASLDAVRRDVRGEIKHIEARTIPFVAGALVLTAASLLVRRALRRRAPAPAVERFRIGRFALIEARRSS